MLKFRFDWRIRRVRSMFLGLQLAIEGVEGWMLRALDKCYLILHI